MAPNRAVNGARAFSSAFDSSADETSDYRIGVHGRDLQRLSGGRRARRREHADRQSGGDAARNGQFGQPVLQWDVTVDVLDPQLHRANDRVGDRVSAAEVPRCLANVVQRARQATFRNLAQQDREQTRRPEPALVLAAGGLANEVEKWLIRSSPDSLVGAAPPQRECGKDERVRLCWNSLDPCGSRRQVSGDHPRGLHATAALEGTPRGQGSRNFLGDRVLIGAAKPGVRADNGLRHEQRSAHQRRAEIRLLGSWFALKTGEPEPIAECRSCQQTGDVYGNSSRRAPHRLETGGHG
ncbi:hypothetical protein [Saccharopolyspora aridisoli]|uniref:hypothetical protein n=1 Tax=Saccharopolyspora aridisoli TaxID=2530385 RepID=UPI001F2EA3F3|nr:hypothetical protein [Saccharopolyspora aridisoli]